VDITELGVGELAALICTELEKHGISTVLSGGSCVTIHAQGRYVSGDLDFVLTTSTQKDKVEQALAGLGFRPKGRAYARAGVEYSVDILPPPPAVGDEPVGEVETRRFGRWTLRLLSPTDCVKDRLAAYFHWADPQALEQALLVCEGQGVDLDEVRRWSRREGMAPEFREFEKELRARSS
jgi:hypothetical protein